MQMDWWAGLSLGRKDLVSRGNGVNQGTAFLGGGKEAEGTPSRGRRLPQAMKLSPHPGWASKPARCAWSSPHPLRSLSLGSFGGRAEPKLCV